MASRNRAQPSLRQDQPVPSRGSKQPALPPVQTKKGHKTRGLILLCHKHCFLVFWSYAYRCFGVVSYQWLLAAEEAQDGLVPSHWPDGIPKQAMYALGFDNTRHMFGNVLDMQQREEEFALVRTHQRHVGSMLIETWLDDVLGRDSVSGNSCLEKGSTQRRGLQAHGVARSQLKEAGLTDMLVDRLHRSLYVYSVGFGDMLQVCTT